jgi:hypothetical protein
MPYTSSWASLEKSATILMWVVHTHVTHPTEPEIRATDE